MENKLRYMGMIQNIINRMSSNSFSLKGWAVTLVAGIFALASKEADKAYFLIAYIPIIVFWGLDSYYLLQERLYRALYNKVRKEDTNEVDFSMDTSSKEFKTNKNTFINCVMAKTEVGFYFPLALLSGGIIIITHL